MESFSLRPTVATREASDSNGVVRIHEDGSIRKVEIDPTGRTT